MPGNIPVAPVSVIATWPEPNYVDPTQRTWLPAYGITLHVIATVLVTIRIGLRARREGGGFGLDDTFLIPSWLLATGFVATASWASYDGLIDRHIWDVLPQKLWQDALNAWLSELQFVIGTCLLKVSVLLFYRRIVDGTFEKKWKYAVWGAIAFTVSYTLVLTLSLVFNCDPTEAYWRAYDPKWTNEYRCQDTRAINPLAGVLSIVSDLYSIVLPCLMLWNLPITRRQKFGLNGVFCLGLLVVGAAGGRTWALTEFGRRYDVTWIGFWVYVWSLLEFELGLMCTCAPSLRVFFKRYLRGRFTCSADAESLSSTYNRNHDPNSESRSGNGKRPGTTSSAAPSSYVHDSHSHVAQRGPAKRSSDGFDEVEMGVVGTSAWPNDRTIGTASAGEQFLLHIVETSGDSYRMGVRQHEEDHKPPILPESSAGALSERR